MKYEDLAKYVFAMERVDWELHNYKSRKRELVQARQMSIYLANWFWPLMNEKELVSIFEQSRSLAYNSLKSIKSQLYSDKNFRPKIEMYIRHIRAKIEAEEKAEHINTINLALSDVLADSIERMEIIAKAYCDIKGLTLTKI
jgi:hypothetical protein